VNGCRFSDAIRFADAAAKLDPRNPEAVVLLRKACAVGQMRTSGNDLFNAGKFFEACAAYGEGLESDPMNPVLLCNRAACRSKLGQWEKAIEDCDAALNAQPNYIKALMRRANCNAKVLND
jgi:DnaJ family protein C protein 7